MTSLTDHHAADGADMGPVEPINDKTPISLAIVLLLLGSLGGAALAYGNLTARVAVIETSQGANQQRLQRIEDKLDRLLEAGR